MNKQNQYINEAAMQVENRYDFRNEEKNSYRINKGLTPEIIEEISAKKDEPQWMRDFRLRCLKTYHDLDVPPWGPSIDGLNIDNIVTYVKPNTSMQGKWNDVPEDIKDTFEKMDNDKSKLALSLLDEAYFCGDTLNKLKEKVEKDGVVTEMCQGSYNIDRENPALKSYNTTIKNYQALIKQITELLPNESENNSDNFDDDDLGDAE